MSNPRLDRLRAGLALDKRNGWLGGVCAGVARYFKTDANFIRVGAVVAALFMPKIVIATYLVAWLLLSER